MSEYQYYEFQALDRRLTAAEMARLRTFSTRARITPTSFVNTYDWGDFKGDENAWMDQYFDAFLYFANWGTRVFSLRLPSRLLAMATAELYCGSQSAAAREHKGNTILTFNSDEEEDEWPECALGADSHPDAARGRRSPGPVHRLAALCADRRARG